MPLALATPDHSLRAERLHARDKAQNHGSDGIDVEMSFLIPKDNYRLPNEKIDS